MQDRAAELQRRIDQVIERLRRIQRAIAGSHQPAGAIELETLQDLGRSYAALQQELQAWHEGRSDDQAQP